MAGRLLNIDPYLIKNSNSDAVYNILKPLNSTDLFWGNE
jgi:hypothetical protein